jgi:hypothetical protein
MPPPGISPEIAAISSRYGLGVRASHLDDTWSSTGATPRSPGRNEKHVSRSAAIGSRRSLAWATGPPLRTSITGMDGNPEPALSPISHSTSLDIQPS